MKDTYSRGNSKKNTRKLSQIGNNTNRMNNSAIKEQTILHHFLLEKKSGIKNPISQENQLKHNKSCEEGIWGTHSSSKPHIFREFKNNQINTNRKNKMSSVKRTNKIKKNINHNNNTLSKNLMTEIISRSNNKGLVSVNNSTHNIDLSTSISLIKKLDEKFKTIEEGIIDKNFEKNIDNDEMILTSKKTFFDLTCKEDIQIPGINRSISFELNSGYINNEERNSEIIDKFLNIRNDFELIYTDNYAKHVREDLLKLEVQLVIEKLFELQNEYHQILNSLRKDYFTVKSSFKENAIKFILLKKQNFSLQQQKEKIQFLNSLNTFVNNHKIKHDKEVVKINLEECALWKKIIDCGENTKNKKKILLFKLFDKIVLNNKKNSGLLSEVEKMICDKINKKYNNKKKNLNQTNQHKNINNDVKNNVKGFNNAATHTTISTKNYRTKYKQ